MPVCAWGDGFRLCQGSKTVPVCAWGGCFRLCQALKSVPVCAWGDGIKDCAKLHKCSLMHKAHKQRENSLLHQIGCLFPTLG